MHMNAEAVAVIGLGNMGSPIARNLLASGFTVTVFNRSRDKAEPLAALGAAVAESPAGAVRAGGVVISLLSNDSVLEEAVLGAGGFADALGEGGLHISMSTVSPETSRKLAAEHARRGSLFVAAPVFGRPDAAAARTLWICLSGSSAAKARAPSYALKTAAPASTLRSCHACRSVFFASTRNRATAQVWG